MTLDKVDCVIDGLRVKRVGEKTFEIVRKQVDDLVTLPDAQIFEAVVWLMSHAKVVPEGAAAAPVAALLHGLVKAAPGARSRALLAAPSGEVMWSDQYERAVSNIFDVQSDIAFRVHACCRPRSARTAHRRYRHGLTSSQRPLT